MAGRGRRQPPDYWTPFYKVTEKNYKKCTVALLRVVKWEHTHLVHKNKNKGYWPRHSHWPDYKSVSNAVPG